MLLPASVSGTAAPCVGADTPVWSAVGEIMPDLGQINQSNKVRRILFLQWNSNLGEFGFTSSFLCFYSMIVIDFFLIYFFHQNDLKYCDQIQYNILCSLWICLLNIVIKMWYCDINIDWGIEQIKTHSTQNLASLCLFIC